MFVKNKTIGNISGNPEFMKKREFIKTSSLLIAGTMVSPLISCNRNTMRKNWAGNLEYSASNLLEPENLEQAQEAVRKYDKIKSLGTRHSFNRIADSTENQISLKNFEEISLDKAANTVTVGAGISYGKLSPYLDEQGYALHNLASLPHISVAGACATATHGSGDKNGNLATAVQALEMINAEGDLVQLSREKDGETFNGVVVGLGALGVVTRVTLDLQPTFTMRQDIYENLPMDQLESHFDEIELGGYSVSLFTDYKTQNINQVWVKSIVEEGQENMGKSDYFGAMPATRNLHPIKEISAENCTEQMGVPGPWYERMPHFRMDFTPSSGTELQTEFFVPRHHAVEAIKAIHGLRGQISPLLMISEIRTIAADNFWMSPCYQQPSVAIHFTWKQDWKALQALLPVIEKTLAPFDARPHWGKLFSISPARLQSLYKKLPDFKNLALQYDPQGKFRNDFLEMNIFNS